MAPLINIILGFFLLPSPSWAFPEMSRHGYVNCTSCHLNSSGGGLLTSYGRDMSKEVLSTWAQDSEQNFAYGLWNGPEYFLAGAYVRGLQLFRETPDVKEARVILMQADVEAAYNRETWAMDASAGRQELGNGTGRFFSRRHYFIWRMGESHNLKIGRFLKFYGLNDPNHNLYVRRDLSFGQDTEAYALEYSYLGNNLSGYASVNFGNFGDPYSTNREKGAATTLSYHFFDKQKVGFSYYYASDDLQNRNVYGPWAIIMWLEKFYSLSELDFQDKKGFVTSHKLAYEAATGMIPYVSWEFSNLDWASDQAKKQAYSVGFQFFPRPHFEFLAQWQKEKIYGVGDYYSDLIWIMTNVYL